MKCTNAEFKELSSQILEDGRTLRFQALGASMYPFIRDRQYISVKKTAVKDIVCGDIVCFCGNDGRITVHRVIKKGPGANECFLTRGDFPRGSREEEKINAEQIIGKVVFVEKGRYAIDLESVLGRYLSRIYGAFLPLSRYVFLFFSKTAGTLFAKRLCRKEEKKLLSMFCRVRLSAEDKRRILSLIAGADVDWAYIVKRAKKEGLGALIYHHIKENPLVSEKVPGSVGAALKGTYYGNAARNMIIEKEAGRILSEFDSENIRSMILKGLYLSKYVYQNSALRPMNDIDILIEFDDLPRVNKILTSLGYREPVQLNDFIEYKGPCPVNSLTYFYPDGFNFIVHIHWHIVNATWPIEDLISHIDMKDIWSCTAGAEISGARTLRPSYEYMLVFLLQHAFTHNFDRQILAVDIFGVLDKFSAQINWDVFYEQAGNYRLEEIVYFTFFRLKDFSCDMPADLRVPKKNAMINYLYHRKIFSRFLAYILYFKREQGIMRKIRFILRTLFPARRIMAHNLNLPAAEVRISHYASRLLPNFLRMTRQ